VLVAPAPPAGGPRSVDDIRTDRPVMILIAGLMICTTLSVIPCSCWWRRPDPRIHPEPTTGEPRVAKVTRAVREEADGKGPKPQTPRRRPPSL
jgi:hypothetical protein